MNRYSYDGPVMIFDHCVRSRWSGETLAVSEQKARNNLAYQYKKLTNRAPDTRVRLPGLIRLVE